MKPRSVETKLRYAKRDLNNLKLQLETVMVELAHRRTQGGLMANLCYINLK